MKKWPAPTPIPQGAVMNRSFALACVLIVLGGGCGKETLSVKAQATRAYWVTLHSQPPAAPQMTKAQSVNYLRYWAVRIESLPTKDVDAEAVQLGLAAAAFARKLAQVSEYTDADDTALFVRSFVNGYTGNWEGAASDFSQSYAQRSQAQMQLKAQQDRLSQQEATVCASLTRRYGIEFTTASAPTAAAAPPTKSPATGTRHMPNAVGALFSWVYNTFGTPGVVVLVVLIGLWIVGMFTNQAEKKD